MPQASNNLPRSALVADHYHIHIASRIDAPDHVPCNEQLPAIYPERPQADAAFEIIDQAARDDPENPYRWHFVDICFTDRQLCVRKVNGLTSLDKVPIVANFNRTPVLRAPADLRFYWVPGAAATPYALLADFCPHRHKSPEKAAQCRRKHQGKISGADNCAANHARLIVEFPDRYRAFFPIMAPPPELRYRGPLSNH